MALKHFMKGFLIDPNDLENSDFVQLHKGRMGTKLYNMAIRVFNTFISKQDVVYSGGYFIFAMVMGHSGQAMKKDVDHLWQRMTEIYGDDDVANDAINRILGTICMLCVAEDTRSWLFKDDLYKQDKVANDEIPEPNEYFLGDYKIPKKKDPSDEGKCIKTGIEELKSKYNRS